MGCLRQLDEAAKDSTPHELISAERKRRLARDAAEPAARAPHRAEPETARPMPQVEFRKKRRIVPPNPGDNTS